MIGNVISSNGANGILIDTNSSPIITANTISNNTVSGIGINFGSAIISGNNISYNKYGISDGVFRGTKRAIVF